LIGNEGEGDGGCGGEGEDEGMRTELSGSVLATQCAWPLQRFSSSDELGRLDEYSHPLLPNAWWLMHFGRILGSYTYAGCL
jgi:hypothetical protein